MPESTNPQIITKADEAPTPAVRRGLAPVSASGRIDTRDIETTSNITVIRDDRRMPARRTAAALPRVVDDPTRPLVPTRSGRHPVVAWEQFWANERILWQRAQDRNAAFYAFWDARLDVASALVSGDEDAITAATAHAIKMHALPASSVARVLQMHAETGEFPAVAA